MDIQNFKDLLEAYDQIHAPVQEAVKGADTEMRKAASAERRAGDKPLPKAEGEKYSKFKASQISYIDKKTKGKYIHGMTRNEEVDIFDVVLEFLQAEGFAETLEEAEWIMANVIDEEAIDIILGEAEIMKFQKEKGDIEARMDSNKRRRSKTSPYYTAPTKGAHGADYRRRHNIAPTKLRSGSLPEEYVDEAQVANRDPEKYERKQDKKYAPVPGERTPMPPRGDKRREDFERWYAANVR